MVTVLQYSSVNINNYDNNVAYFLLDFFINKIFQYHQYFQLNSM